MKLEESLLLAKEFLGKEIFDNLNINYSKIDDKSKLVIKRENDDINIQYGRLSSLFFSLSYIKENINKTNYEISLNRNFDSNGFMHDCSRNGPINIKQAKQYILLAALFGQDMFMLYTEETYEIEGEKFFGYMRGRYTKQEIKEIDEFAQGFGIELVPCIQTLSHLNQAFKWCCYGNIAETSQTVKVGKEETYEFIEKMIKTCSENFSSRRIHIGMDEAWDLGTGYLRFENRFIDKKKEFLIHLNRVVEICKKYNLEPMMWEDMFFRFHKDSKVDWYENSQYLTDDIKQLIPDVDLIYWDYYHNEKKVYDDMFKASKSTGKKVIFADGCFRWIGFVPNIVKSLECLRTGLTSAVKNGIREAFTCSWGDCGNECSVNTVYHCFAIHALFDFFGKGNDNEVSKLLKTVVGYSLKEWSLLELPNRVRDTLELFENPSKLFFYQDILIGLFDTRVKDTYASKYVEYSKTLKKLGKKNSPFAYIFTDLAKFSEVLSIKVDLGVKIRNAYKNNNKEELQSLIKRLDLCAKKINEFVVIYREQWLKENKPFGYEVIDSRTGYLLSRISYAKYRINDYLSGKIDSIPELEEEIVPFENISADDPITVAYWSYIATTNVIC